MENYNKQEKFIDDKYVNFNVKKNQTAPLTYQNNKINDNPSYSYNINTSNHVDGNICNKKQFILKYFDLECGKYSQLFVEKQK